MNIKSLLIGSAALAAVSTGAQAADAIVVAEPEPMEYVRICDVYGAGFFYIPGTETCLKIGGYMRYDVYYSVDVAGGLTTRARFAPSFDVRSDSEVGTIRGYAELEIDYFYNTGLAPAAYGIGLDAVSAYIQVIRPNGGSWLFGRAETPYTRFLGYSSSMAWLDGYYSYRRSSEISYTFNGSNGFNFIAAIVNDGDADFLHDGELGLKFSRGWGEVGAIVGYDSSVGGIGAKASLQINFPNTSGSYFKLMAMYASVTAAGGSVYGLDATSTFSVLAAANFAFSQKVSLGLHAQWLNSGNFFAGATLPITVAPGLEIRPEVAYDSGGNGLMGMMRFQRSF